MSIIDISWPVTSELGIAVAAPLCAPASGRPPRDSVTCYVPSVSARPATVVRGFFGLLTLVAIAAQLKVTADAGVLNIVNFFSYFTIQSNLVGAAVLLVLALRGSHPRSVRVDWWRGAASVYLTVTFAVVILLLSNVDVGLQLPWVDFVLHKLIPVVVVADFILDPPLNRLSMRDGLLWLVYPIGWITYTMIRGALAGWYPYPFLDPANGGYGTVAVMIIATLVSGVILCAAYVAIGKARAR